MPLTPHNTELYQLGKGILYIDEWSGTTPPGSITTDVGNCSEFTVEVTIEKLPHYSARSGSRKMDKTVVLEVGYTLSFVLDEPAIRNLQKFLLATLSGTTVLYAGMNTGAEYALKFVSDNVVGENETWEFWRCELAPAAAFNLISDDWSTLQFTGTGLADDSNHAESPYFTVTWNTTTTTTSTTTTTV